MDESLWRHLPTDIMETLLILLPFATAMRFKTVCKSWRELLTSQFYYRRRYQTESKRPRPWLFLSTSGSFSCAFDFMLNRWHRIPNPALHRLNVVSAAGNLVCLGNLVTDCRVLSICDPFKKSAKRLPPMNRIQFIHKVSMNLQRDEESGLLWYRIMVSGEEDRAVINSGGLLTEVYDSRARFWSLSGQTLPEAKFGLDAGVWLANRFYCIVEMPFGVVVFDQNKGVWEELEAAMPPAIGGVTSPSLVECDGRLLMVLRSCSNYIQMWELRNKQQQQQQREVEYEWEMLEEMPGHIHKEFMQEGIISQKRLICCGAGAEWVWIMLQNSPSAIAYNLRSKKWEWMAKDPAFPNGRRFHLFAFPLLPTSPCQL